MVGKLVYSRVLQNRMLKNKGAAQEPVVQERPAQYYSGDHERDVMDSRPFASRPDRSADPRGDGNKIRRGPGRRLDKEKEKRMRNMDPALMQKYSALPEALQEKVNATIQICYQQHMADIYKNPGKPERSHYDTDVRIDAEGEIEETQAGLGD
jgi:hypothetical protein